MSETNPFQCVCSLGYEVCFLPPSQILPFSEQSLSSFLHPLLSLLVPSNSYSYNESILKCAISLEFVLDYEFGDKKTKLSLKRVPKSQSLTISRQIAQISKQQIFNRKEKEEIAAIFEKRNHCAHAGTKRFDKEAALEVIGQTARLLNTYLRWKKEKVFPSSIQ